MCLPGSVRKRRDREKERESKEEGEREQEWQRCEVLKQKNKKNFLLVPLVLFGFYTKVYVGKETRSSSVKQYNIFITISVLSHDLFSRRYRSFSHDFQPHHHYLV